MSTVKKSLKTEVKEYLLAHIREHRLEPGARLPTQRQLAEQLSTSPKVSEVALTELFEEGIIERRVGQGTFLSLSHKVLSTPGNGRRNIFVLISNLRNPQFAEFAAELEVALHQHKRRMRLVTSYGINSYGELVNQMHEEGCGGIITFAMPAALKSFIRRRAIPAVHIRVEPSVHATGLTTNEILLDVGEQARLLAEHLLSLGHRTFFLAGGPSPKDGKLCYRFRVMQRILQKAGMEVHLIPEQSSHMKDFEYEAIGRELAGGVLQQLKEPAAVVFYNTIRALAAMKMFQHVGKKIPQDLSVAGFDNIFAARLVEPALTVIEAGYLAAAQQAGELIVNPGKELQMITIPPLLCPGGSTALHIASNTSS
ncbi:MAG: GntR family transcriptional regulator [Lentisphaeria bacterium]|nr:GntR family transcriptional regulator [Lentisphaeria bacterium]